MSASHVRPGGGLITDTHSTAIVPVGTQWTDNSNPAKPKRYVFCYNGGADSIAADDVVSVFLTTPTYGNVSVTAATQCVNSDATTTVAVVAGIALGTVATTEYAWMQVGGYCDTGVTTDDSIDVGDLMYCADNAKVATTVSETYRGPNSVNFGWSPAADGGTTLTACWISTAFDF